MSEDVVTFKDVTSAWDGKTRGGMSVIRVEKVSDTAEYSLFATIACPGLVGFRLRGDGHGSQIGKSDYDLIPKPAPKSPWERIRPFVNHWWRGGPDQIAGRIVSYYPSEGTVRLGSYGVIKLDELLTYEHSADAETWERVE